MGNLLSEPILTRRDRNGDVGGVSLPALFAALMADEIEDLPSLRPHQRQPMQAFLSQMGALALYSAGEATPPTDSAKWAALLRGLTPEFPLDEPWTLVVADVTRPAFLQPPIPEGTIEALKESEQTPDALDMLVTSKNHDVKAHRIARTRPEHWLAALLTLQTMEGFLGAGNYGISRMNGGFASRPMVGLVPRGGIGARLQRDIKRLIARRDEPENEGYARQRGKALLWLEPWDGSSSLRIDTLDPWYIEVCRRVRLTHVAGQIVARRATSKVPHVDFPKNKNGVTGDPWTPVNLGDTVKGEKALTLQGSGFSYQLVTELLDPRSFRPAPLQWWRQDDGTDGLSLVMTGLARGQGETAGFHERRIPLPPAAVNLLGKPDDRYADIARRRVGDAGTTRRTVLRIALFVLFQNAPDTLNLRHAPSETKAERFLASFDRRIDGIFFEGVAAEFEADPVSQSEARQSWLNELLSQAREVFEEAAASVPLSGLRRYQTIEAGRSALEATFRKRFLEKAAETA